jgi:restriction system protein
MAIPDYQTVMLPLLRLAGDGREHSLREAIEKLADHFGLDEEERDHLLPSGRQATFDNRVGWARTYMKKAGLLRSFRRGYFEITDAGLQALKLSPEAINNKFLEQYPEFQEFKAKSGAKRAKGGNEPGLPAEGEERTPREVMDDADETIRNGLVGELLEQVMQSSPTFFERLVVDLLVSMGYGGTRRDAGKPSGKAETRVSTGSSRRIAWGWRSSTSRRSAGKTPCIAPRFRSSSGRCTDRTRGRAYSSPPPSSRKEPPSTSRVSKTRSS